MIDLRYLDLRYLDAEQLADLRARIEEEQSARQAEVHAAQRLADRAVRAQIGNVTREPDPSREPANTPLAVTMRDGLVQDRLVEFSDGRSAWVGQ